jgi:peptide/nickel transport system permease protein
MSALAHSHKRFTIDPLVGFALRRIAIGVALVSLVSVLVFASTQVLPGDAAEAILGRSATPEQKAILRDELGLNDPLLTQYWRWASGVLQGDLGTSVASRAPVTDFISGRLRNSLILATSALVVLIPVAIAFGIWAGIRRGRAADHLISSASLALIALPEFVTGTLLITFIAVSLEWLPPTSIIGPGGVREDPTVLVLPVLTLCLTLASYIIRMVRAGVGEVLTSDYVHMARLNGIPERRVIVRHAMRNALAPTVQVVALTMQYLIGGLVIVENVFAYPGIGQGLVQAVVARDIPTVQGIAIVLASLYIVINIVADIITVLLIPKLRTTR